MQALTSKAKQVERKPMNFWEKLYIPAIAKGMAITFSHIFKKKPTINYPEQTRPFSPVFRGVQVLNRDEEGRERCTACGLCAVACPAEAIIFGNLNDPTTRVDPNGSLSVDDVVNAVGGALAPVLACIAGAGGAETAAAPFQPFIASVSGADLIGVTVIPTAGCATGIISAHETGVDFLSP